MTVVLKAESSLLVFVKGADTSIEKILSFNQKYL
jgi:magnesium-transporting ATPase (P-type)